MAADKFLTAHHGDAGVKMLSELDDLLFKRVRAKDVGGRIDEIASIGDRLCDALNLDRVDLVGRDEARLGRLVGLETVVTIEGQQEAKRGEIGVLRRVGEPVDAFGKRGCKLTRGERVTCRCVRFVDSE